MKPSGAPLLRAGPGDSPSWTYFLARLGISACSVVQRRDRSFGNCNVLLDRSCARPDGADDAPAQDDGDAAAKNDHFAGIAILYAEKGAARLRQFRQFGSCFVENSCRLGFVDR